MGLTKTDFCEWVLIGDFNKRFASSGRIGSSATVLTRSKMQRGESDRFLDGLGMDIRGASDGLVFGR